MHAAHELLGIPLTRPADTLSPTGGERRGEGVPFMESFLVLAGLLTVHELIADRASSSRRAARRTWSTFGSARWGQARPTF